MRGIGTTYTRDIISAVQDYLLEFADDILVSDGLGETAEEAFVAWIDSMLGSRPFEQWGTPYNVLTSYVNGGSIIGYYSEAEDALREWGLNPERYNEQKNWETYCHLIARDGAKLYDKLKVAGF